MTGIINSSSLYKDEKTSAGLPPSSLGRSDILLCHDEDHLVHSSHHYHSIHAAFKIDLREGLLLIKATSQSRWFDQRARIFYLVRKRLKISKL